MTKFKVGDKVTIRKPTSTEVLYYGLNNYDLSFFKNKETIKRIYNNGKVFLGCKWYGFNPRGYIYYIPDALISKNKEILTIW